MTHPLALSATASPDMQGALIIALFLGMIALMYTRKISALLALPILGVGVALIGAIPYAEAWEAFQAEGGGVWAAWSTLRLKAIIVDQVIKDGAVMLKTPYTIAMIGGMLAIMIKEKKIAETLIKYAAELSGDNPVFVAVMMMLVVAMLFTSMGGLGAIIMTGTIVFPIMMSLGIPPLTAAGIYLIGFCAGGTLNPGNWALYESALGLEAKDVQLFAFITMFLYLITGVVFLIVNLKRGTSFWATGRAQTRAMGVRPIALLAPVIPIVLAFRFSTLTGILEYYAGMEGRAPVPFQGFGDVIAKLVMNFGKVALSPWFLWVLGVIAAGSVVRFALGLLNGWRIGRATVLGPAAAALTLYLLGVLVDWISIPRIHAWASFWDAHIGGWDYVGAFFAGIVFTFVATYERGKPNIQTMTKAIIIGAESVIPAVLLMIGLGIVLQGMWNEGVRNHLAWYINNIVPSSPLGYVITFSILAPLALYRGPLNVWGLGLGVAALIYSAGQLGALPIMAVFMSVGAIQGVCDPTNTHNIWIASYIGEDVMRITRKTIAYVWTMAIVGLVIADFVFRSEFTRPLEQSTLTVEPTAGVVQPDETVAVTVNIVNSGDENTVDLRSSLPLALTGIAAVDSNGGLVNVSDDELVISGIAIPPGETAITVEGQVRGDLIAGSQIQVAVTLQPAHGAMRSLQSSSSLVVEEAVEAEPPDG